MRAPVAMVLAVAVLAMVGCAESDRRPVEDSTLVSVLVGLHLLEAEVRSSGETATLDARRDSVFDAHDIDAAVFEDAIRKRSEDLNAYLDIYDAVLGRLNEMRLETSARHDTLAQASPPR